MRLVALSLLMILYSSKLHSQKREQINFGDQIKFNSDVLGEDRILNVFLPDNYSPDSSAYPVIFVLDGSLHEDFYHISGAAHFCSFPWLDIMQPPIVVGIENVNRYRDFTSPCNKEEYLEINPDNGGAENFIRFLNQEVFSIVDSMYHTDAENRSIIGQSLGGLIATQILVDHTNMFANYVIVSPSLWWDDMSLLNRIPNDADYNKNVFIAVGEEGKTMKNLAKKLANTLRKSANKSGKNAYHYLKEFDHGDILHIATYKAFEWLGSL